MGGIRSAFTGKGAAFDDLPHSLCAGTVLPAFVSAGKGQPFFFGCCSAVGSLVFDSVVCVVAVWRQTLSVERVVRGDGVKSWLPANRTAIFYDETYGCMPPKVLYCMIGKWHAGVLRENYETCDI